MSDVSRMLVGCKRQGVVPVHYERTFGVPWSGSVEETFRRVCGLIRAPSERQLAELEAARKRREFYYPHPVDVYLLRWALPWAALGKVGISRDMQKRLKSIRNSLPEIGELTVAGNAQAVDRAEAELAENRMLVAAEHLICGNGEWFWWNDLQPT